MTLLKGIVVSLVLANAGYFLWVRGVGKPPEAEQSAAAPTLALASESPDGARAASADAAAGVGSVAGGQTGNGAAEVSGAESPAVAAASGGPPAGGSPGAGSSAADTGAPSAGSPAAGSPAAGTTAAGSPAAGAPAAAPSESSATLLTNVKRCVSVGPFRDVSEAAHAATTLRSGGYDPRQRVADGEVWAGVWVYLPRPASRAAGEQMLARLKAGGIDDALEMPGPNEGPVISLGLYSESKRAEARVAQVQALGFNPAIADRKRSGNVYWIDIDLKPTDGLLNPADLQAEAGRIVRLEVKACPSTGGASP